MSTRLYLSASGETTPINPNPSTDWGDTSILARVFCSTVKRSLAMTSISFSNEDFIDENIIFRQYISHPLTSGQTITGFQSLKAQCRVSETSNNNNLFFTVGIRIIAANGTTIQKTILDVTRDNVEAAVSLINRQFTATSQATNYTTVAGDRLVIEIGMGGSPNFDFTDSSTMRLGDASATDLSEDNTSTTDNNPWVQLTDTLTFKQENLNDNITLFMHGHNKIEYRPFLYWSSNDISENIDKLQKSYLDGTKTITLLEGNIPSFRTFNPLKISSSTKEIFFGNRRSTDYAISRTDINKDNNDYIDIEVSSDSIGGIGIHNPSGFLYWSSPGGDYMRRSNLDGSNIITIFSVSPSTLGFVGSIDVDTINDKIYWTGFDESFNMSLFIANLDGSSSGLVSGSFNSPYKIILDIENNKIYYLDFTTNIVYKSNLDGSNIEILIDDGEVADFTIDIENQHIYSITLPPNLKFQRSNFNGSGFINLPVLIDGLDNLYSITIDLKRFNLFIHGKDINTDNINLFIFSSVTFTDNVNLFIHGFDIFNDNINLFINGHDTKNSSLDLFVYGHENIINNISLIIIGHVKDTDNLDLVVLGKVIQTQNINLFVSGKDLKTDQIDLFIKVIVSETKKLDIFISGPALFTDSIDLFLKTKETNNLNLFIKGLQGQPIIACPILDPTASIQISDDLIKIYQSRIDALINQLGKNILLEFDPIKEPCSNCQFDSIKNRSTGIYKIGGPIPFERGRKCPYCKGIGFLENMVNKCIKVLIQWNPKDAQKYGISVDDPFSIVRFKGFLTDGDDMVRARAAISNHDIENQIKLRVKLIRGPIAVGLRESRYCISFWQLLDS